MLMVAHRLSTLRHVDRVLLMEEGRIEQDGRFDALAASPGLFRDLLEVSNSRVQKAGAAAGDGTEPA